MRFIIGTVDGKVHKSRRFSARELQEQLNDSNGFVGTGDLADTQIKTVEEFIEMMGDFLKYNKKNDRQNFNFEVSQGWVRNFNVQHIVWWEVR